MRMRHYPFSHRHFLVNVGWDTTKPTGALGPLTPHFNMVVSQDTDYASYGDLWRIVYSPDIRYATRGEYTVVNDSNPWINGRGASDPTWWPKTSGSLGGHYHQMHGLTGFDAARPVSLNLSFGASMPWPRESPAQRQDRRTIQNKYWPNATLTASGALRFTTATTPVTSGGTIARFTIIRRFGYEIDPFFPINPSSPIRTIPAVSDYETTPVLPTIWHQGVEGEFSATHTYENLNNVLTFSSFQFSTFQQAEHQPAIDEYQDLYNQLLAVITGFTGTFEIRAAATPHWNLNPTEYLPSSNRPYNY